MPAEKAEHSELFIYLRFDSWSQWSTMVWIIIFCHTTMLSDIYKLCIIRAKVSNQETKSLKIALKQTK